MEPGSACDRGAQSSVGDDLKPLGLLVSGTVKRRRGKDSYVVGPAVEPHQSIDVPGRRRGAHRAVFQRDNHEESAPGRGQPALKNQSAGGLFECRRRQFARLASLRGGEAISPRLLEGIDVARQGDVPSSMRLHLHKATVYNTFCKCGRANSPFRNLFRPTVQPCRPGGDPEKPVGNRHAGEPILKAVTSRRPISLTPSVSGVAPVSQTCADICVSARFSSWKCLRPGSALNHDGSERGPL